LEFRYGTFARTVALPEGIDEDRIQARYDKGVLEVVFTLKDQAPEKGERHIPVRVSQHLKPT
jgi:HSP20 family molecular chaperone IbpA